VGCECWWPRLWRCLAGEDAPGGSCACHRLAHWGRRRKEGARLAKAARSAQHGLLVASSVPFVAAKARTVDGRLQDEDDLEPMLTVGSASWDAWGCAVIWGAGEELEAYLQADLWGFWHWLAQET
jgi:hypothetical protein